MNKLWAFWFLSLSIAPAGTLLADLPEDYRNAFDSLQKNSHIAGCEIETRLRDGKDGFIEIHLKSEHDLFYQRLLVSPNFTGHAGIVKIQRSRNGLETITLEQPELASGAHCRTWSRAVFRLLASGSLEQLDWTQWASCRDDRMGQEIQAGPFGYILIGKPRYNTGLGQYGPWLIVTHKTYRN